jgi:hypothetical protein
MQNVLGMVVVLAVTYLVPVCLTLLHHTGAYEFQSRTEAYRGDPASRWSHVTRVHAYPISGALEDISVPRYAMEQY